MAVARMPLIIVMFAYSKCLKISKSEPITNKLLKVKVMNSLEDQSLFQLYFEDRFIQSHSLPAVTLPDPAAGPSDQTSYEKYLKREIIQPGGRNPGETRSQCKESDFRQALGLCQPRIERSDQRIRVQKCFKSISIPDIVEDFYLNLLDWSHSNIMAIAINRSLFCWKAHSHKTHITLKEPKTSYICSVKFSPDTLVAVGGSKGNISVYDMEKQKYSRLLGTHSGRVCTLDWSDNLLASGSKDGHAAIWDIRARKSVISYRAHQQEISGLRWNAGAGLIATGGNDNKLVIYDVRGLRELHKFHEHRAAIKAIDWCPDSPSVLATGGGTNDRHLHFFNTKTLSHQFSIDTGSQICNLRFSRISHQILTTHGYSHNQINTWTSSSLWSACESVQCTSVMLGHTARVLYMAEDPSGECVATAAGDGTLRFWRAFQGREQALGAGMTLRG